MENPTNSPVTVESPDSNIAQGQPLVTAPESNRTLLGVLSYLGPLVIVSLLIGKQDSFVKFHAKQGLVIFSIEIIAWIIGSMFYPLWMILQLVNLCTIVLSIIGIVNVVNKKETELPLVGQLSKHFPV